MKPFNILVEQPHLLLNFGALIVDVFDITHLVMLLLQAQDPFVAVCDLFLFEAWLMNVMGSAKSSLYLSLFDGFIDFWEPSACLAKVGELAL